METSNKTHDSLAGSNLTASPGGSTQHPSSEAQGWVVLTVYGTLWSYIKGTSLASHQCNSGCVVSAWERWSFDSFQQLTMEWEKKINLLSIDLKSDHDFGWVDHWGWKEWARVSQAKRKEIFHFGKICQTNSKNNLDQLRLAFCTLVNVHLMKQQQDWRGSINSLPLCGWAACTRALTSFYHYGNTMRC